MKTRLSIQVLSDKIFNIFKPLIIYHLKPNEIENFAIFFMKLQSWKKLMAKRQKTALLLTPQAMYNQFKRPSAGSVSELYYIYRKT